MPGLRNFVGCSTTTTGTGDITLAAALPAHRTFLTAFAASSTTSYMVLSNGEREVGFGFYDRTNNVLQRTLFLDSTTGAKLNLSGTSQVYVAQLAQDFAPDWPALIASSNQGNSGGFAYFSNSSAFTTIPLNVSTDTHGGWDNGSYTWTCPAGQAGLYDCQGKLRLDDGSGAVNFGLGLDIANQDSDGFQWQTFPSAATEGSGSNRFVAYNSRLLKLVAGDKVRLFCYIDSGNSKALNKAMLSILRVK